MKMDQPGRLQEKGYITHSRASSQVSITRASVWTVKPEEPTIFVLARVTAPLGYAYDLQPKATGSWSLVSGHRP